MLQFFASIAIIFSLQNFAFAQKDVPYILSEEWHRLRDFVQELTPEGEIGGYYKYKMYGKLTLMWRLSKDPDGNEVIRFYKNRKTEGHFAITYHKSNHIIEGRTVLRRFLGPEPSGWINHTIDYNTGEYLQTQGHFPFLYGDEYRLMKKWNITPIRE